MDCRESIQAPWTFHRPLIGGLNYENRLTQIFSVGRVGYRSYPMGCTVRTPSHEIDCFGIFVRIPLEGERILVVQGNRSRKDLKLVLAINMRKYLEKDRVMFLVHIVDKGANVKNIQNILIEWYHTEVFPKDLSGLPPTRIVEFRIDLGPKAEPVTKIEFITLVCTSALRKKERQIDAVCRPYLDKFMIIFIDDIPIYSRSKEEHKPHLDTLLRFLKDEKWTSRGHDSIWVIVDRIPIREDYKLDMFAEFFIKEIVSRITLKYEGKLHYIDSPFPNPFVVNATPEQVVAYQTLFAEEEKFALNVPSKSVVPSLHMIRDRGVKKKSLKKGKRKSKERKKVPPPSKKESGIRSTRILEKGIMVLDMGNRNRAKVEAIRSYFLNVPSGMELCLEQCNNSPSVTRGVIFVSCLRDVGFKLAFMHYGVSVSNDNMFYCNAFPRNGLCEIDMDGRTSHSLVRYYGYLIDLDVYDLGDHEEPETYREVMVGPKSDKSIEAMNAELQIMKDKEVWTCLIFHKATRLSACYTPKI
uniref:Reverse transcriptase domain-containing protein n=1 Tax=Tanacetum cinerariifolium TaxID=118510 RepID=A0A6L2KKW4_TANCI|nr:hypothetical protein [Tanacetum cinerariifolium]